VLHEASKGQLTQKQAAEQLGMTERQARRLVARVRAIGDRAVVHGLRVRMSNRRIDPKAEQRAMAELSQPACRDFGPTYAAEHLGKHLGLRVGKDTVRKWMIRAGLWRSRNVPPWKCMLGGSGVLALANWCSGTHPCTTGWRDVANACIWSR
jgi:hypothetical protein